MDASPSFALEKGFSPLRLSIRLFIYFLFHRPPSFKGFQWLSLPEAHIWRTNGRVSLSGIINRLLLRSRHIVLARIAQNSLHLCVHVVAKNLLMESEDCWKKIRSKQCVGNKMTFLSFLPTLQEQGCQAVRVLSEWGLTAEPYTQFFLCLSFCLF